MMTQPEGSICTPEDKREELFSWKEGSERRGLQMCQEQTPRELCSEQDLCHIKVDGISGRASRAQVDSPQIWNPWVPCLSTNMEILFTRGDIVYQSPNKSDYEGENWYDVIWICPQDRITFEVW